MANDCWHDHRYSISPPKLLIGRNVTRSRSFSVDAHVQTHVNFVDLMRSTRLILSISARDVSLSCLAYSAALWAFSYRTQYIFWSQRETRAVFEFRRRAGKRDQPKTCCQTLSGLSPVSVLPNATLHERVVKPA